MLPASERCPVLLCPILPCPVVASRRIALFKERSYMELRHTSNADALAQRGNEAPLRVRAGRESLLALQGEELKVLRDTLLA